MGDEEKIQVDEEIVAQLAETAAIMSTMIAKLSDTHDAQGERLAFFREELVAVRDSLRRIAKVLLEGNGDKPLIARMAIVEEKVRELEEEADDKKQKERISSKGKYAVAVAVISGLAGVITSIISLLS